MILILIFWLFREEESPPSSNYNFISGPKFDYNFDSPSLLFVVGFTYLYIAGLNWELPRDCLPLLLLGTDIIKRELSENLCQDREVEEVKVFGLLPCEVFPL